MIVGALQHHSVLDVLRDHLQVVWGALVAFVVVVLLTPAVGGMARMLGAVDAPGGRRPNRSPVPRLGGLALFLGIFVPALAFLPLGRDTRGLLLGAAVAVTVGAVDDFRGLRWFEKLAGQTLAAAIPTWFGVRGDRRPFLSPARARRTDRRHHVRRRPPAQARRERVRGGPGASAPSLPAPRLLGAEGGLHDLGVVPVARSGCAYDAVHSVSQER